MEPMINMSLTSHKLPYSTQHFCPECGKEFTGRRNRIFCSIECKIRSNNSKAAKMSNRVSEQVKMLKRNAQILEEVYSVQSIPLLAKKEELIKKGFVLNSPTIRIKVENGVEWHMIGRYVFRPDNEESEIQIMTKEDLEKIKKWNTNTITY
jgi:hypothetical protein